MGETATLFDEGLYFEIRHGRDSLDPLLWLAPNRLSKLYEQQFILKGNKTHLQNYLTQECFSSFPLRKIKIPYLS